MIKQPMDTQTDGLMTRCPKTARTDPAPAFSEEPSEAEMFSDHTPSNLNRPGFAGGSNS